MASRPTTSLTVTVRASWTHGQASPLTLERQQRVAFSLLPSDD